MPGLIFYLLYGVAIVTDPFATVVDVLSADETEPVDEELEEEDPLPPSDDPPAVAFPPIPKATINESPKLTVEVVVITGFDWVIWFVVTPLETGVLTVFSAQNAVVANKLKATINNFFIFSS